MQILKIILLLRLFAVSSSNFDRLVTFHRKPSEKPLCSGVIIANYWILTVSHCFDNFTPIPSSLAVKTSKNLKVAILKAILHPLFARKHLHNDVALVETAQDLLPNLNLTFALDSTLELVPSCEFFVLDAENKRGIVKVNVFPFYFCQEMILKEYFWGKMCVVPYDGRYMCNGNSGSPLFCAGELAGLDSYGFTAECASSIEIVTKVDSYRRWIYNNINLNED